MEVRVEGFSPKLGLLTRTIFQRLATLHTQVLALLRQGCVSWRGAMRAIAPLSARCTGLCSVCLHIDAMPVW